MLHYVEPSPYISGQYKPRSKNLSLRCFFRFLLLLAATVLLLSTPLHAQTTVTQEKGIPSNYYFNHFMKFYEGDYKEASQDYESDLRSAFKIGQTRYLDSICYEAMTGECYYQMGMLDTALEHYTEAIRLYLANANFMTITGFAGTIKPNESARQIVPWGASKRRSVIGNFPDSVLIQQNQIASSTIVTKQGIYQQGSLMKINPQEIVRMTALAIRRRTEILGPLCRHDPLTSKLLSAVNGQICPSNHWTQSWGDLLRGLAQIASGREGEGVPLLQRAITAGGDFDHPMTCIALVELGKISLKKGNYAEASSYFEEATFAAVNFSDWGVLEEAFRGAAAAHIASNPQAFYAPLLPASDWSKGGRLKQLQASLYLSGAENYIVLNQLREAKGALDEAKAVIGKRQMLLGDIGARLNYNIATLLFQDHKIPEASIALQASMTYMQHGSRWLYHIGLADQYYLSKGGQSETSRIVIDLFNELLRDPTPNDWVMQPMESIAILTTPHPIPYEHWFEVAMSRKQYDLGVEISDRIRRYRFVSSMPLGGRLGAFRWILEAPAETLDQNTLLRRQDIKTRFPQYAEIAKETESLQNALAKMPVASEKVEEQKAMADALAKLASISVQKEAFYYTLALRREPGALQFPPVRSVANIQQTLPPGQAVLAFFATSKRLYGFLLSNSNYSYWELNTSLKMDQQVQKLLHSWGLAQGNSEIATKDIADEKWKTAAAKLIESLFKGSRGDLSKSFQELVIVPDSYMWYLPFEALPVTVQGKQKALIEHVRVRYAPTVSLATPYYPRSVRGDGATGVVLGKLNPKIDDAVPTETLELLKKHMSNVVVLPSLAPAPSPVYNTILDRLIVLDDLPGEKDPLALVIPPADRSKSGNAVRDWIMLPWGGPREVLLPGFHTASEDSMKRVGRDLPGNDMFLTICCMMTHGTRTILLSRWRSGGQSSYDLLREFAQELPHVSPAEAWQRAVGLQREAELKFDREPRLKKTTGSAQASDEPVKGDHPFFWAAYMVVDSGRLPEKTEEEADAPVVNVKEGVKKQADEGKKPDGEKKTTTENKAENKKDSDKNISSENGDKKTTEKSASSGTSNDKNKSDASGVDNTQGKDTPSSTNETEEFQSVGKTKKPDAKTNKSSKGSSSSSGK